MSGLVTSLVDGHALNGGTVELLYADDRVKASDTKIESDGWFHFVLVPEGEYLLAVRGAGDGDFGSRGQWNETQAYEDSSQPVTVQHDLSDIVAQLKVKANRISDSR
ncbi:MAG: hypothetical protein WA623_16140 [Candidatus Sulfotelmatobacter sp.]